MSQFLPVRKWTRRKQPDVSQKLAGAGFPGCVVFSVGNSREHSIVKPRAPSVLSASMFAQKRPDLLHHLCLSMFWKFGGKILVLGKN